MVALNNEKVEIQKTCVLCGKTVSLMVRPQDVVDHKRGKLVQNAFPYLSADERELFVSGICGTCFDEMFKGDDE